MREKMSYLDFSNWYFCRYTIYVSERVYIQLESTELGPTIPFNKSRECHKWVHLFQACGYSLQQRTYKMKNETVPNIIQGKWIFQEK